MRIRLCLTAVLAISCSASYEPVSAPPVYELPVVEATATAEPTAPATAPTPTPEPTVSVATPEPPASSAPEPPASSASVVAPTVTVAPSSSASAAAAKVGLDGSKLKLPSQFLYDVGHASLRPESTELIDMVKAYMDEHPEIALLRIEVHTDNRGADEANQRLSEERALAVAKALVRAGISCKRLIAVGFGETRPISPNDTAEGRQLNRRTELHIALNTAKPGRRIPVDGGGKVAGDTCK